MLWCSSAAVLVRSKKPKHIQRGQRLSSGFLQEFIRLPISFMIKSLWLKGSIHIICVGLYVCMPVLLQAKNLSHIPLCCSVIFWQFIWSEHAHICMVSKPHQKWWINNCLSCWRSSIETWKHIYIISHTKEVRKKNSVFYDRLKHLLCLMNKLHERHWININQW